MEDGEFGVGDVVRPDPDVEQAFADETEHAAVVRRIGGDVQSLLQFEENVEEPGAIAVEKGTLHDEHVEAVPSCRFHRGVERLKTVRMPFGDDFACGVQINRMVRVRVLRIGRFYEVVSWLRQYAADRLNQGRNALRRCLEKTSIVAKAYGVGIMKVLPCPIQSS